MHAQFLSKNYCDINSRKVPQVNIHAILKSRQLCNFLSSPSRIGRDKFLHMRFHRVTCHSTSSIRHEPRRRRSARESPSMAFPWETQLPREQLARWFLSCANRPRHFALPISQWYPLNHPTSSSTKHSAYNRHHLVRFSRYAFLVSPFQSSSIDSNFIQLTSRHLCKPAFDRLILINFR